jgi:hypothetical protein
MSDDRPGYRVELDLSHFALKGDLPARGLLKAARRGMLRAADLLRASVANKAANGPLQRRTGMLARTFRVKEIEDADKSIGLGVVNDAEGQTTPAGITYKGRTPYADILEHGGVIRPVKGQWLAIPTGPAVTGAGVAKYRSPRDVAGLFFAQKKGSASALLMKAAGKGKTATAQAWFILVKESKIPAFHYIQQGFDEGKPRAIEEVNKSVNSFINSEIISGLKG